MDNRRLYVVRANMVEEFSYDKRTLQRATCLPTMLQKLQLQEMNSIDLCWLSTAGLSHGLLAFPLKSACKLIPICRKATHYGFYTHLDESLESTVLQLSFQQPHSMMVSYKLRFEGPHKNCFQQLRSEVHLDTLTRRH